MLQYRTPKPFAAAFTDILPFGQLPQHIFIESSLIGSATFLVTWQLIGESVKLPLSGNRRIVASGLEQMGECFLTGVQIGKVRVVPKVVLACHQFHSGCRADRRRVTMIELDTFRRQRVKIGRLVVLSAVAPESFPADIIGHDQNDVRLVRTACGAEVENERQGNRASEN